jgi:hypothetical protein
MGAALLAEYEDLLGRESIWRKAPLTTAEREAFLDIFLSIMELAVAGQADYLGCEVTQGERNQTH